MHFALKHVGLSASAYVSEVVIPAYVPIIVWAAVVALFTVLFSPRGYLGAATFGAAAFAAFWFPMLPLVRSRLTKVLALQTNYDPILGLRDK